jgi:GNAT superfamily N-acetyltransferase
MIRRYHPCDKSACLAIFDSNCPKYLDPSERADFEGFLNNEALPSGYLVLEKAGGIIACGGISLNTETNVGWFCWGLVDRSFHKQGFGRQLTQARIDHAKTSFGIERLLLDTSQLTVGFYEKFGFRTVKVTKDGYGPGLDRHDMELPIKKAP